MIKFDNLIQFISAFNTEEKCRDYLTAIVWKDGEVCPYCGNHKIYHFKNGAMHKCAKCRKQFSIKVGTIFEDSHIPLTKWFMAVYLLAVHKKGISSCQLARDLGITQKSAWFMIQRLQYAMATESFAKPLDGIVEVDETYVGGIEKNKHANRRTIFSDKCQGDKVPFLGIQQRGGDLRLRQFAKTNKENIKPIMDANIAPDTLIMTDESPIYKWVKNHAKVNHREGIYTMGAITTNRVEGVFSHFKRTIRGIYHKASEKHIQKYADMFCFRWNTRGFAPVEQCNLLLADCRGKRLQYRELIK